MEELLKQILKRLDDMDNRMSNGFENVNGNIDMINKKLDIIISKN